MMLSTATVGALPKPGEIVYHDFRKDARPRQFSSSSSLRLVQWNIERGYKLGAIIKELQALDADIIALQEIDIGCDRSGGIDTGVAIARELGMHYAFVCEFEELRSPVRDAASQGGGVHGNAILTRHHIAQAWAVEHSCHPVDWEDAASHPAARREPRRGRRFTLGSVIHAATSSLLVYSAHLEVFCGMLARMHQFSDILRDSRLHSGEQHQAILGDLNTMANGIARLSPKYCTDRMRWATLGWSEAEVWDKHVFSVHERLADDEPQYNAYLRYLGLPLQVCQDILNPGFKDPFNAHSDTTLDNPKYRLLGWHLMTGKLDWMLLRNLTVQATEMGNHNYSASDHKWLCADVKPMYKNSNSGIAAVTNSES